MNLVPVFHFQNYRVHEHCYRLVITLGQIACVEKHEFIFRESEAHYNSLGCFAWVNTKNLLQGVKDDGKEWSMMGRMKKLFGIDKFLFNEPFFCWGGTEENENLVLVC